MKSLFSLLVLSAGILLGGETLAQQPTQLTPEQQRTVRLIKKLEYKHAPGEQAVEKMVRELDPILVSKYMVFSDDWLKVIGNDRNRQVTREQFKTWTDSLDKVYECYEEFMGKGPLHTDMIYVDAKSYGIANAGTNHIQFSLNKLDAFYTILDMRRGIPGYVMLHEMGHVFATAYAQYVPRESAWMGETETATRLLTSYALEQSGFKTSTKNGPQHRYGIVNNALNNYRLVKIDDFKYEEGSAYDLYMLSLPNFVGWDTIKKAVQSYDKNNNTYTKTKTYDPGNNKQGHDHDVKSLGNSRAHEFFDRIAYFHDQARELAKTDPKVMQGIPQIGRNLTGDQIFNSFPDRGALRAKYFTVETYPLDYVKPVSAPVAAAPPAVVPKPIQKPVNKPAVSVPKTAVSKSKLPTIVPKPVQKPTPPAVPPEEEIKTLQAEIKILQDKLDSLPKTRASEPEMIHLYNDLAPLQNRLNVLLK